MPKTRASSHLKPTLLILTLITILILGYMAKINKSKLKQTPQNPSTQAQPFDFTNQTITLNDQSLTFTNGVYSETHSNPASVASITTRTLSSSQTKAAAILSDSRGGQGTFYYLIGASLINGKEIYSTPIPLNGEIKILSIVVDDPGAQDNGLITIQYLDRPSNAPLTTQPMINTTKKYAFQDNGDLLSVLH